MTEHRIVSRDDVISTDIQHKSEEHFAREEVEQKCNCIVYHFARNDGYFWARTYTDEISTGSVYGL